MSHLVSVLYEICQQVVHVQDAAFGVFQMVGLHGDLPVLDTKTPVSTDAQMSYIEMTSLNSVITLVTIGKHPE